MKSRHVLLTTLIIGGLVAGYGYTRAYHHRTLPVVTDSAFVDVDKTLSIASVNEGFVNASRWRNKWLPGLYIEDRGDTVVIGYHFRLGLNRKLPADPKTLKKEQDDVSTE